MASGGRIRGLVGVRPPRPSFTASYVWGDVNYQGTQLLCPGMTLRNRFCGPFEEDEQHPSESSPEDLSHERGRVNRKRTALDWGIVGVLAVISFGFVAIAVNPQSRLESAIIKPKAAP